MPTPSYTVLQTEHFGRWTRSLDPEVRARVLARISRVELGNPGADTKHVGSGVRELRRHFGPGYRIYVILRERTCVILLAGGDKSSQRADIALAVRLAHALTEYPSPRSS